MSNIELSIEKDPHLRKNGSHSQNASSTSNNRWAEAMKDVPSYSEHMKQMKAGSSTSPNAFNQASGQSRSVEQRTNAFSRVSSAKTGVVRSNSNKASAGVNNQSQKTGTVQSAGKSK